jgi:hypothetical protein
LGRTSRPVCYRAGFFLATFLDDLINLMDKSDNLPNDGFPDTAPGNPSVLGATPPGGRKDLMPQLTAR